MRSSTVCFVAFVVAATLVDVSLRAGAAPVVDVLSSVNSANSSTADKVNSPSEAPRQPLPSVKSSPSATTTDAAPGTNGTQSQLPVAESSLVTMTPSTSPADAAIKPEKPMISDEFAMPSDSLTDDVTEPVVYDDVSQSMTNQNDAYEDAEDVAILEQLLRPRETRRSADDIDVSPRAMAEYLLLTGDFRGVQQAIDDFVSTGLLTPEEAEKYEDAVGVEYTTMSQENFLPQRDQRSNFQDSDEVRDPTMNQVDYEEYLSPSNVADDTGDDDVEQLQRLGYLPIDPDTMAQIDDRILQEFLQQSQPSDDDERYLEEAEQTPAQVTPTANETDGAEAELESLSQSETQGAERVDNAEEELEQIGKLLRTTDQQGESTANKKP